MPDAFINLFQLLESSQTKLNIIGALRTQWNIYDGAFLRLYLTGFSR